MSPWKITKIDSSSPNIKLRVGTYKHPGVSETRLNKLFSSLQDGENGSRSIIVYLKI